MPRMQMLGTDIHTRALASLHPSAVCHFNEYIISLFAKLSQSTHFHIQIVLSLVLLFMASFADATAAPVQIISHLNLMSMQQHVLNALKPILYSIIN